MSKFKYRNSNLCNNSAEYRNKSQVIKNFPKGCKQYKIYGTILNFSFAESSRCLSRISIEHCKKNVI